jgi:hypothetical protein
MKEVCHPPLYPWWYFPPIEIDRDAHPDWYSWGI